MEADILARCESMERDYDEREKRWKAGLTNVAIIQENSNKNNAPK